MLQLSVTQVVGTAAAAVTAAVLCSFLGVVGTVVGTAITSITVTAGGALYQHSLRRTQARLRAAHAASGSHEPVTQVVERARTQRRSAARQVSWPIIALGTANVFVFAIGVVTGIEGVLGTTLPAEFGVAHSGSDRTSLGSALGVPHNRRSHHPSPTPTPSATPTTRPSPTATLTTTPTPTVTTTVTESSSPAPTAPSTPVSPTSPVTSTTPSAPVTP